MFDYKGQSPEELLDLCSEKNVIKSPIFVNWVAEVYAIGKCLRYITKLPKWFPLDIYTEHGPGNNITNKIDKHEMENSAYCHFVASRRTYELYKKSCNKRCYHYKYPAITYKEMKGIKQSPDAKGTIVYPMHSVDWNKVEYDIDDLCNQLNALPDEYKPICICLHYHDINKGQHEEFIKRGFPVYTAGHPYDDRYIDRFYDILKNFKYSMSNEAGSYLYYSVDLGIPFSIIGKPGKIIIPKDFILDGKVHRPKGEFNVRENYALFEAEYQMFKDKPRDTITDEQREYVRTGLGYDSSLSTSDLKKILINAAIEWYLKDGKLKNMLKNALIYAWKHPFFLFRRKFWNMMAGIE